MLLTELDSNETLYLERDRYFAKKPGKVKSKEVGLLVDEKYNT